MNKIKKLVIDLDDTICKTINGDYLNSLLITML